MIITAKNRHGAKEYLNIYKQSSELSTGWPKSLFGFFCTMLSLPLTWGLKHRKTEQHTFVTQHVSGGRGLVPAQAAGPRLPLLI